MKKKFSALASAEGTLVTKNLSSEYDQGALLLNHPIEM